MKHPLLNVDDRPGLLAEASAWITGQTGLAIHEKDRKTFLASLEFRLQETDSANLAAYLDRIQSEPRFARSEAENLAAVLTPAETYFLRDQGQMRVIEEQLLPRLCTLRHEEKRLRLWSAGCASGEEAWSLSIILARNADIEKDWNITILGTDISQRGLEKARHGEYGEWSFRQVPAEFRQRHFRPTASGQWTVDKARLPPVQFFFFNLLADNLPDPSIGLHDIDLIVCRNVFIYFAPEAIQQVVTRLIACLRPGGFLVTGHGELSDCRLAGVKHVLYSDSSVYQKTGGDPERQVAPLLSRLASTGSTATSQRATPDPPLPTGVVHQTAPAKATASPLKPLAKAVAQLAASKPEADLEQARHKRLQGYPGEALKLLDRQAESQRQSSQSMLLAAHCQADLGHNEQARSLCRALLQANPLIAGAHYLLAQIDLAEGNFAAARESLRATLYVAPEHPLAQLDLAALAERDGDPERAARMRQSVLGLLARLPADQALPDSQTTPAELLAHLRPAIPPGAATKAR